jgi:amidase
LEALIAPTTGPSWKTDYTNGDSCHFGSSSPAAISGYTNITVPIGFIEGLPVGLSIFGLAWTEKNLMEIAYAYEQSSQIRKAPKPD